MNYHLYILTAYLPIVEIRLIQNDREETRTEELNCVGPSQVLQVEGMGEEWEKEFMAEISRHQLDFE